MGFWGAYWGLSKFTVTSVEIIMFSKRAILYMHELYIFVRLFRVTSVGRMRKDTAISFWALVKKTLI